MPPAARLLVMVCAVAVPFDRLYADTSTSGKGGIVEGTVTYRADPARNWRYGRYYIKDAKQGWLAEAVVALRNKGLGPNSERQESTHTVDQKNFRFIPETLAIQVGDSVEFRNSDPETHNVHAIGLLAQFNAVTPPEGEYQHRFEKAGGINRPVKIGCVFHGAMRSWIFIFDHPHFAVTKENGRFRLENVPEGQYTLQLNHPAGELRWEESIIVKAGETSTLRISLSPDNKTDH